MKENNVKWRLFAEGIQNSLFYMLFPFIIMYLNTAWGPLVASAALASISIMGVISGIYGGIFADKFGRSRLIIITSLSFFFSILLFIIGRLIENNILIYLSFGVISIAYSIYMPVGRAYFADWLKEDEQKKIFVASYQVFNIAVVCGPLLGSFVFDALPVWFIFGSIFSTLILIYISICKTPEKKNITNNKVAIKEKFVFLNAISLIFIDKRLLLFVLGSVFAAQAFMQLEILLPAKVMEDLVKSTNFFNITLNSTQYFASLLMLNGILVIILGSVFSKLSSHYSNRFGFVSSSFLYGFSMIVFAFAQNYLWFLIAVIIFTIAELLIVSTQDTYIAKIAPEEQRARYFAAANIRYSISRIFAPQLLALVPLLQYKGAFLVAALSAFISAIIFIWLFQAQLSYAHTKHHMKET